MKVIIVGGSIAGLTLALALKRAGVDFVLLEASPEIGPQLGASLGLHPHGVKISDQLGVWKDLSKLVVPLRAGKHFDSTGYCFAESKYLEIIENDLGYPTVFLERSQFLSAMYDHVQDKSKVLAGKVFASYTEERNTVFVRAMDGSEYAGDILAGADGVHSRVRKVMSETVKEELPGGACIQPDDAGFTSEYKAIFAISRTSPEICPVPEGHVYNTYFQNHSTVVASGVPGLIFWFLFVKTPQYLPPDIPRYINEDAQKLIDEYQNIRLCPEFTVKEAWEARTKGVLIQLEEGILDRWSHGRVVLVGDAIHKVTINAGLGGNLAMEGVVTLTNLLHSALR